MERWKELQFEPNLAPSSIDVSSLGDVAGVQVKAEMSASVWKVIASPGEDVKIGETILVVEAMKAEFEVKATSTLQLHVKRASGPIRRLIGVYSLESFPNFLMNSHRICP